MLITDEVRPLILNKADASSVKKVAISQGMISMRLDALHKVFKGITSVDEIVRMINQEESSNL